MHVLPEEEFIMAYLFLRDRPVLFILISVTDKYKCRSQPLGFHLIFLEKQYKAAGEGWNEVLEYLHLSELGNMWYLWMKAEEISPWSRQPSPCCRCVSNNTSLSSDGAPCCWIFVGGEVIFFFKPVFIWFDQKGQAVDVVKYPQPE